MEKDVHEDFKRIIKDFVTRINEDDKKRIEKEKLQKDIMELEYKIENLKDELYLKKREFYIKMN